MSKKNIAHTTPPDDEILASKIYMIRKQKVMLDRDLANLYGVETRALKQAVRRNIDRFPEDFMFEMSDEEFEDWRSQFVTSNSDKLGLRYAPFCFIEQGVAMLSSVLNSKLAIQINIQIMRIFTRMRQLLADNTEVKLEIAEIRYTVEQIANKQKGHDQTSNYSSSISIACRRNRIAPRQNRDQTVRLALRLEEMEKVKLNNGHR